MGKIAITGRIIDGTGGEPIQNGVVLIDGDKIEKVGDKKTIDIPSEAEVIDAGKGTVLPGLIDAHIHLMGARSLSPLIWISEPEPLKIARTVRYCADLLDAGFTACRDVGGYGVYLKRAIEEGSMRGPRISSANKVLTQTGGHGDTPSMPLGYVRQYVFFSRMCDGADECRKAAREQFREGADLIKICTTGALMSEKDIPGASQFTMEEITAIVEEATRVGKIVAAHAQWSGGIKNALKAGVKTIEHGSYIDDEAIELFLKNDAMVVPTFAIFHQSVTHGAEYGMPEYWIRKVKEAQVDRQESIRKAHKAGVKVALGTDYIGGPLLPFGENAVELELLVNVGFTPMEAIIAGTLISAEAMQMRDVIGSLEVGKLADVIIVDGDPLKDVTFLKHANNVKVVIKGGKIEKHIG